MSVTHHLGGEWIMAYASGALSEGEAVLVASHLSFLPDARKHIAVAEAMGGALIECLAPSPMETVALADALARIDGMHDAPHDPRPFRPSASASQPGGGHGLPAPLHQWMGGDLDALDWNFLGPGMRKATLWGDTDGQRLTMLRARPGARIPRHDHSGTELVLVLRGHFFDERGIFRPGDVNERHVNEAHAVTIGRGEECMCLALTHGPLLFESPFVRLFQRIAGLFQNPHPPAAGRR